MKTKNLDTSIINTVETSLTNVSLREGGIIEIRFKLNEYEVDVADQNEIEQAILKLTNNGSLSFHIMVIPGLYGGVTKEAREMEMFESKAYKDQKSISIILFSLFQRLLATMYFSFKKKKLKYPHKFFVSEELALEWIAQQENRKKKKKS